MKFHRNHLVLPRDKLLLINDVVLAFMLGALFLFKIQLMRGGTNESIIIATFHHDTIIFGVVIIFYIITLYLRLVDSEQRLVKIIVVFTIIVYRLIVVLIIGVYFLDILTYYQFSTRLYITDLVLFAKETQGILSLIETLAEVFIRKPIWKILAISCVLLLLGFSIISFIFTKPTQSIPRTQIRVVLLLSLGLIGFYFIPIPQYVYSYESKPLHENYIERNMDYFFPATYSSNFKHTLQQSFEDPLVCRDGMQKRYNIIIVIVESLSAYHSNYFSGLKNYTPNLDFLAKKYIALPNFYANGWTTQGGLISLLTAAFPIVPEKAEFNEWGSPRLKDFGSVNDTLPIFLRSMAYRSYFFCAGDLSFMGQDQWLKSIGFDYIEGHEATEYRDEPRGPFKSVPDKALYDRALSQLRLIPEGDRFFMVLETLWSHRPFLSSDKFKYNDTEEGVFRYVDDQLFYLYGRLKEKGFFNNGILIITGDHRAMEPFEKNEWDKFGLTASARIPMVIISENLELPAVIDENFQQHDLLPSIKSMVSEHFCRSSYEGVFLEKKIEPPPCIIHMKGEDRDLVYVRCGKNEGIVRIKGDDTTFISGGIPDEQFLIDKINYERIRKNN